LPSITELLSHMTTQSKGTLIVESVENIGAHYARALRLWKEKFIMEFDDKIATTILSRAPTTSHDMEATEIFRRKWEVRYVLSICYMPRRDKFAW